MGTSININRSNFYEYKKPEKVERTKKRLEQLIDMGMTEVGEAQFGIEGIMSGLYLEYVWSWDDERWDDYLKWAEELKTEKTINQ